MTTLDTIREVCTRLQHEGFVDATRQNGDRVPILEVARWLQLQEERVAKATKKLKDGGVL
jgi:DNA-binding GntR family transcriptional regulator